MRLRTLIGCALLSFTMGCGGGSNDTPEAPGENRPDLAGIDFQVDAFGGGVLAAPASAYAGAVWSWSQVSGPGVQLWGADTPSAGFQAPQGPATLVFQVVATMPNGEVFSDRVTVTVEGAPEALFRHLSSFAVTGGGEAHAEVVAHHAGTQRVFIVNAEDGRIDVYSIADPSNPTFVGVLNSSIGNTIPNSVDVSGNLVAAAFENVDKQAPGSVIFFHAGTLTELGRVTTGALPDMVGFSPDGNHVLTADEGEPNDIYTVDPLGTVTVISLDRADPDALAVIDSTIVDFSAFNGQLAALRASGVRIFGPGATVAQDLEPEFLAFDDDGSHAYVVCQENNAFAIIDVLTATVERIVPMGLKAWDSIDVPHGGSVQTYTLGNLPTLGTTVAGDDITLGGFSGLWLDGVDAGTGEWLLTTVPDRGPVLGMVSVGTPPVALRPYVLPDYQARLVHLRFNPASGLVQVTGETPLHATDGATPITGRTNLTATAPGMANYDEMPVDLMGAALPLDPLGADFEGVCRSADGSWWLCDEYRPSLYRFDATGKLMARLVPMGAGGAHGQEVLPEAYGQRRVNRGFEAIAFDPNVNRIYAWIQSPLDVPDTPDDASSKASRIVRILEIHPGSYAVTGEFVQVLDCTGSADKIGDAVWAGETGAFYVIERNSSTGADAVKKTVVVRVNGATNLQTDLVDYAAVAGPAGALESTAPGDLAGLGVVPVKKSTFLDMAASGYTAYEKPEGLARLPDGRLLVLNDNDFGIDGATVDFATGLLTRSSEAATETAIAVVWPQAVELDASDRDGPGGEPFVRFRKRPIHGMYQPDGIASFVCAGETLLLTCNEGDARDYDTFTEEFRVGDGEVVLDPTRFPDWGTLTNSAELGRLRISVLEEMLPGVPGGGDLDGDGDQDQIRAYGARSFSIWNAQGGLVYDSGDRIGKITAALDPERFNQNGPNKFDERSDDKGAEPEGAEVGVINGRTYGFVGLERHGGVMVFDLTEPAAPRYKAFLDNPFDVSPEGIRFVEAAASPTGRPLLLAAHEVSGTVAIYELLWE